MSSYTTLDPKLDIVFKMLFGRPENRELLVSLLDAVLHPPSPISSVQVESELGKETVEDKGVVLDLRVALEDGQQVDVEMQTQPRLARRERALYYWARMYGGQLGRGQGYDALRRCVVVQILAFREPQEGRFHSVFRVSEARSQRTFSDHFELHLLELPNLITDVTANEEPTLAKWGKFLEASNDEEREALAMTDPVLRKAKDALDALSADPDARVLAEMRELAQKPYQVDLGKAHREGFNEGKAEGFNEGKAEGFNEGRAGAQTELLLRLMTVRFGTIPPKLAERVRQATESELLRWSERLLTAESLEAVFEVE